MPAASWSSMLSPRWRSRSIVANNRHLASAQYLDHDSIPGSWAIPGCGDAASEIMIGNSAATAAAATGLRFGLRRGRSRSRCRAGRDTGWVTSLLERGSQPFRPRVQTAEDAWRSSPQPTPLARHEC
jgi:hypothetical protein